MNQTTENIEHIYTILDRSSTYVAHQFDKLYLEALIDTAEQLFQQESVLELDKHEADVLQAMYEQFEEEKYSREDVRRGFQLAVLKGMKEAQSIPGTGVTADSVVMFVGYLAQKLLASDSVIKKQTIENEEADGVFTICDPAVGSGNLLTGVCNYIDMQTKGLGLEVDPTLVRLAYVNANLQQHDIDLYHQDGLKPLFTANCDMFVCDLPVGLYPNEKVARTFDLYREGEVYTHHLFIEQAIRHVKAGGYMFFIIPNRIFSEPGAKELRAYITNHTYIQALLQLPQELFQKGSIHKSIFILQKKEENIKKPNQTLLAQLPSFSKQNKVVEMLQQINQWIQTEKGENV